MNDTMCQVTGKIILSGEYAVVFGYPGIAVPCSVLGTATKAIPAPFTVTAAWGSPSPQPLSQWEREKDICGMTVRYSGIENEDYLHHILDTITARIGPLYGHLTIENTIPIGRGMGSSTALVITICRCLLKSPLPFQNIALSIENTVNPSHSGLDFAVIWEGKPVKFTKASGPTPIDLDLSFLKNAVLIDTGKPNETTPEMVEWVKKNSLSPPLGHELDAEWRERARVRGALQTIAHCTERLIAGESPFTVFPEHHRAQVALGVVPTKVQKLIADIEKSGGAAKVIGAGSRSGGGGIVLAIAKNALMLASSYGYCCLNTEHRIHQILGK